MVSAGSAGEGARVGGGHEGGAVRGCQRSTPPVASSGEGLPMQHALWRCSHTQERLELVGERAAQGEGERRGPPWGAVVSHGDVLTWS
eukprot:7481869-Alexandrium_andersonii.AAC.1